MFSFIHDISIWLEAILTGISSNFWLSLLFIFLVCIGEAVFILGLLVPSLPILLLTGGLDPATPPRHADRVARALGPKARQVTVANAGHGVMGIGCVREVMFRFIDAADDAAALAVDASCIDGIPRPPAFEPVTVVPTSPSAAVVEKGAR